MSKHLIATCLFIGCLWCGKSTAQQAYSDKVINGMMPYAKGEVKQKVRFINSLGLKKYSEAELAASKKAAQKVVSVLLDWLNKNPPQGYEASISTFLDILPDPSFGSPFNDPHPKIYTCIELHFAPYVHTPKGKYPDYTVNAWVSIFLNSTDKVAVGSPIAGNIYVKPGKVEDFFGADICQTNMDEVTLVSRNNAPIFLPVSQEEFLRACIKDQSENKKNTGISSAPPSKDERRKEIEKAYKDILEVNKEAAEEFKKTALENLKNEDYSEWFDLESKLQKELDEMAVDERRKPAFHAGAGDVSSEIFDRTGSYSGLCPEGHREGCEALVRVNPKLVGFTPDGQIKMMAVQWKYIKLTGSNRDKPRFYDKQKGYNNAHQWNMVRLYQQKEVWESIFNLVRR